MGRLIASLGCIVLIVRLFRMDREKNARDSRALWIPTIYLLIICSRPVSVWLELSPGERSADGLYSSPLEAVISFVLLALAVLVLIHRSRKSSSILRGNGPVLLFFSYAAVSMVWSDFPFVTLKHWTKGIEDVAMVLLVLTDSDPLLAVRRILTRAAFILIPMSPVLGHFYPEGRVYTKGGAPEFVGVATQKNQLGQTCLILGLATLWCFLSAYRDRNATNRRQRLIAHGCVLAIVGFLLQQCQSLTSTVALVLTGSVMLLASQRSVAAKPWKLHVIAAVALAVAVVPIFIAPSLVETMGRDTTLSGRTQIWTILPTLVRNHWLGAGYETFLMGPRLVAARALMDASFQEAHNGYLEVYLNLGWIGVFLFAYLLITGYRKIIAAVGRDPAVFSLGLALFIGVLIEGLSEAPFRMMAPTMFCLLWSIMSASKSAIALNSSRRSLRRQQRKPEIASAHGSYSNEPEIRIPV